MISNLCYCSAKMPARDAFIVQLFIMPLARFGAARERQVRQALEQSACSLGRPLAVVLPQNAAERADLLTYACAQRRVAYAEARTEWLAR